MKRFQGVGEPREGQDMIYTALSFQIFKRVIRRGYSPQNIWCSLRIGVLMSNFTSSRVQGKNIISEAETAYPVLFPKRPSPKFKFPLPDVTVPPPGRIFLRYSFAAPFMAFSFMSYFVFDVR